MRIAFFALFGVILLALILLVDWREKWDTIVNRNSPDTLGTVFQPDKLSAENLTTPLEPAVDEHAESVDELVESMDDLPLSDSELEALDDEAMAISSEPARRIAPSRSTRATRRELAESARPFPASDGALPHAGQNNTAAASPFQDVQEQQYMNESRRLLKQTVRNYDRIRPAERSEDPALAGRQTTND